MTHQHGNDGSAAESPRCEAPTFDPRSAFSWTLRAGEIAAIEARRQRNAESSPLGETAVNVP